MALRWRGKQVTAKLRRAQLEGVNATMAAASVHAKRNHPWRNRTGTLEGSIDIDLYAREERTGVRGRWGSRDVRYALIQELGGVIRPRRAKRLVWRDHAGDFRSASEVSLPARPYLRPAADVIYPSLAGRIRRAYQRPS